MKAWLVREKDEFGATVVFAETRSQARSRALSTDACEDAEFTRIEATRLPQADKYYREGKIELDWLNPKDTIVLVKELGFYCDNDAFSLGECEICSAKKFCEEYRERTEPNEMV